LTDLPETLPGDLLLMRPPNVICGGVTKYLVCDNLKSAVFQVRLYDPDVNKTFVAYANHAGFAVLPARPRRPKDKANIECHVGIL
jgi:transposase